MTNQTEPTWIREGGTVAIQGINNRIEFGTIERLTPTVIVLADGRRFRRDGYRGELLSDNGHGHKTNRHGSLVDPTEPRVVDTYARQMLRAFVLDAETTTYGACATINRMSATDVRVELNRIALALDATRKEIDRRAGL